MGRIDHNDHHAAFCTTVLALKLSGGANGVSRLHGKVSRGMWQGLWPDFPEREFPIGHITNGVHIHTWTAPEMSDLFERHLGDTWRFAIPTRPIGIPYGKSPTENSRTPTSNSANNS